MNCKDCGGNLVKIGVTEDNKAICKCKDCGKKYTFAIAKSNSAQESSKDEKAETRTVVKYQVQAIDDESELPSKFRMMSALSYFGYSILYAIPLLGLIFLIIHACDKSYVNRMHYARSFFIPVIIAVIAIVVWFFVFGGLAIFKGLF